MDRDVEGEPLIGPLHQQRQQDQMGGARDRQEFGEPLEQRQDDDLSPVHGQRVSREDKGPITADRADRAR